MSPIRMTATVILGMLLASEAVAQRRGFQDHLGKARSFLLQRNYGDAEAQARSAIKADSGRWDAHEVLGDALRFLRQFPQAQRAYDDALAKAPADQRERLQRERDRCSEEGIVAVRLEDADNASKAGRHALAASHLVEASTLSPTRLEIALSAAESFVAAKRLRQALTMLERSAKEFGETVRFREALTAVQAESDAIADALLTEMSESLAPGMTVSDLEPLVRAGVLVAPSDARMHLWAARCAALRNDHAAFAKEIEHATAKGWAPSSEDQRDGLLAPGLARLSESPAPEPSSSPSPGADVQLVGGIEVKHVPAGILLHGTVDGGDERRACTITRPFLLGTCEVTRAQWHAVMGWLPEESPPGSDDLPVTNVSWEECSWFCCRMSTLTGHVVRLPTAAEWLLALDEAGWIPRSAGQVDAVAWMATRVDGKQPVRGKKPSPRGFFDMRGNVFEWVADWKGDLAATPATDPQGPSHGQFKVGLGGDWRTPHFGDLQTASPPREKRRNVGFRVLVEVPQPAAESSAKASAAEQGTMAPIRWQPGRSAIDWIVEPDPSRHRQRRMIRVEPEAQSGGGSPAALPAILFFVHDGALIAAFDRVPALADTGGGSSLAMVTATAFEEADVKIERGSDGSRWICRDPSLMRLLGRNDYSLAVAFTIADGTKATATYDLLGLAALREELERPWAKPKQAVRAAGGGPRVEPSGDYRLVYLANGEGYRDDRSRDANAEKELSALLQQVEKVLAGDSKWQLEILVRGSNGPSTKKSHAFRGDQLETITRKALGTTRMPAARIRVTQDPDHQPIRRTDVSIDQADRVVFTFWVDEG